MRIRWWARPLLAALMSAAPLSAQSAPVAWQHARPGIEWSEFSASDGARYRLIAVRVDPRQYNFQLTELATRPRGGAWTIERASRRAVLALNVGQFTGVLPWGWVVRNGREILRPGYGPLSTAVVIDSAGRIQFVDADSINAVRSAGRARLAFQSYPALLVGDARIPEQLQRSGRGVDLEHRDSRLAIGLLADGRLLIVLTRFAGFEGALGAFPLGPTVPEMAELMRALGCRRAVMLDGGISGQLLLRTAAGETLSWRGLRKVPLGLIATPR